MKFWNAAATFVEEDALEVEELDPVLSAVLVEDVVVVAEAADVDEVAPTDDSALSTADMMPPPGGGGGGGALLELALVVPVLVL